MSVRVDRPGKMTTGSEEEKGDLDREEEGETKKRAARKRMKA